MRLLIFVLTLSVAYKVAGIGGAILALIPLSVWLSILYERDGRGDREEGWSVERGGRERDDANLDLPISDIDLDLPFGHVRHGPDGSPETWDGRPWTGPLDY